MRTPQFEEFIAPARHYPEFWRIVVGLLAALAVYMLPVMAIFAAATAMFPQQVGAFIENPDSIDTPEQMLFLLATFLFMALGAVAAAGVHRRGLASLIGPFRPACSSFSRAFIGVVLIYGVSGVLVSLVFLDNPTPNLDLQTWLGYLPLALPLLFIQIFAEELLFRGYLMQALAARFKSALIWMLLPSLLFAIGHYDGSIDPLLTWLIIAATFVFGLVAADLTRITGNLGAATGFHLANNFFALFLVSVAGNMSGLSLYHAPFTMDDVEILAPLLVVDIVTVLVTWQMLRRWLAPKG